MRESRLLEMTSQKVASRRRELKHAIVDDGRTQRVIARRAEIDETRLSRILSGEVDPYKGEMRALSRVLHKPQRVLFPDLFPVSAAEVVDEAGATS